MGLFSDLPALFTGIFSDDDIVAVTPVAGSPRDVTGIAIFRRVGQMIMAEEVDMVSSGPELHMAETDCLDLDEGAAVTVQPGNVGPNENFLITARYPDGRGMVRFTLHEA